MLRADVAGTDVGSIGVSADPSSEPHADHISVQRLTIGSWNLVAKYDEHVVLSFYWVERKLVWEVLHLGVVRKMEVDFEDVDQMALLSGVDEPDRLVIELHRPPRFFKESPTPTAEVNYVYTTDFTNGQASCESRHTLLFSSGSITSAHTNMMRAKGIHVELENAPNTAPSAGFFDGVVDRSKLSDRGNLHSISATLRQPPTSSPRLDAIILQDQLQREMRERQARYTGICPVRARIYMLIFDDLVAGIKRDAAKRANMLRRVHAEAQMSIDAYRTVFERSIVFGGRKLTQAVETKGNLEGVISTLTSEIDGLKKDVNDLKNVCESLEHRAEKKEKLYEVKDKEIIDLTAETQQLQDLLKALRFSKQDDKKDKKK